MKLARLVLLALVCAAALAVAGCGGGDGETVTVIETVPSEPTPEGTTPDEGTSDESTGAAAEPETESLSLTSFQTPSGNIACVIGDEGARCDIAKRGWSAPRPADCPDQLDSGQGLQVSDEDDGPGTVVCAGDTTLNPEADVLAYGRSTSAGDFTCTSEEDGVTCRDDGDNRGFFISKQSYRLF